jgi:hypothetical protein
MRAASEKPADPIKISGRSPVAGSLAAPDGLLPSPGEHALRTSASVAAPRASVR